MTDDMKLTVEVPTEAIQAASAMGSRMPNQ